VDERLSAALGALLRSCVCVCVCVCRLQDANKAVLEERERSQRNNQQLSDYEAEIGLLRRRLETLETDREKDKKTIAHLQDALNRARVVCNSVCRILPSSLWRDTFYIFAVHAQSVRHRATKFGVIAHRWGGKCFRGQLPPAHLGSASAESQIPATECGLSLVCDNDCHGVRKFNMQITALRNHRTNKTPGVLSCMTI